MPTQKHQLPFRRLLGRFAVCRLPAVASLPDWGLAGSFASVTRTAEEVSIVCAEENVPAEVRAERGWTGFKLEGPFAFSQTGILAAFIGPLAESGIAIFAVSTFDTDFVFVKEESVQAALDVLRRAGHRLIEG
jgi:uncharacterized protein